MEIDTAKYKASGAEGELEKPFETQRLREVVEKWVPKTQENDLGDYITAPDLPQDLLKSPTQAAAEKASEPAAPAVETKESDSNWNMNEFDSMEGFAQQPLGALPEDIPAQDDEPTILIPETPSEPLTPAQTPGGLETPAGLDLTPPLEDAPVAATEPVAQSTDDGPAGLDWQSYEADSSAPETISDTQEAASLSTPDGFEIDFGEELTSSPTPAPEPVAEPEPIIIEDPIPEITPEPIAPVSSEPAPVSSAPQELTEEQLEKIIRAQSREVIENVVWKVVPDIAERVIREELAKILKDPEMHV